METDRVLKDIAEKLRQKADEPEGLFERVRWWGEKFEGERPFTEEEKEMMAPYLEVFANLAREHGASEEEIAEFIARLTPAQPIPSVL